MCGRVARVFIECPQECLHRLVMVEVIGEVVRLFQNRPRSFRGGAGRSSTGQHSKRHDRQRNPTASRRCHGSIISWLEERDHGFGVPCYVSGDSTQDDRRARRRGTAACAWRIRRTSRNRSMFLSLELEPSATPCREHAEDVLLKYCSSVLGGHATDFTRGRVDPPSRVICCSDVTPRSVSDRARGNALSIGSGRALRHSSVPRLESDLPKTHVPDEHCRSPEMQTVSFPSDLGIPGEVCRSTIRQTDGTSAPKEHS